MKTYADLRKALTSHPTTWMLRDDAPQEGALPSHPMVMEPAPKARKRKTTLAELKKVIQANPVSDPRLLVRACKAGLMSDTEAKHLLEVHWGKEFSLKDFAAEDDLP